MKILIFGASGFLGRSLATALQSQYEILKPTHKELDLLDLVAVGNYFQKNKPDVVIHCATTGDCTQEMESDVKMFVNVAMNCMCKIIYIGSAAEYGKQRDIVDIKEEEFGKVEPESYYGKAKYAISLLLEKYPVTNVITLRPFGVFGKYEDPNRRYISNAILKSLNKKPIIIYKNVKFSYLFIDDFVNIVKYFIEHDAKHKVYNIAGHKVSLKEVANMINRIGKRVSIKVLDKGMGNEYTGNDERLRKETGIKYMPFMKALKKLYRYHEKRIVV